MEGASAGRSSTPATPASEPGAKAAAVAAAQERARSEQANFADASFMTTMAGASLVTKHWKLQPEPGGEVFFFSIRHYSMSKMFIMQASGLVVLMNMRVVYRRRDPIQGKLEVPFTLSGRTGKLQIDKQSKNSYGYTLTFGGTEPQADILCDPRGDPYTNLWDAVWCPGGIVLENAEGEPHAMFEVCSKPEGQASLKADSSAGAREVYPSVSKTLAEFEVLAKLVVSCFSRSDLAKVVPAFPAKPAQSFADAEVAKYCAELEQYLRALFSVPKMASNPDVLSFVGLMAGALVVPQSRTGADSSPRNLPSESAQALAPEPAAAVVAPKTVAEVEEEEGVVEPSALATEETHESASNVKTDADAAATAAAAAAAAAEAAATKEAADAEVAAAEAAATAAKEAADAAAEEAAAAAAKEETEAAVAKAAGDAAAELEEAQLEAAYRAKEAEAAAAAAPEADKEAKPAEALGRTCSICTESKPKANFSKSQLGKGQAAKCKACVKAAADA